MTHGREPGDPPPLPDSEHARVLAEVLRDQARRREAEEAARVRRVGASDSSFFVQVALLVAGTFFFYLLFFSPAWVAPSAAGPVPVERVEEGLRISIFLTARQVESFREREGRLPSTSEELGLDRPGVRYERVDGGTYRILASTGETGLTYVSSQPVDEFAGEAFGLLREGGV